MNKLPLVILCSPKTTATVSEFCGWLGSISPGQPPTPDRSQRRDIGVNVETIAPDRLKKFRNLSVAFFRE
ncbi:MAG TPA: hypothetical protein VGP06_14540 [Janthinobacterium sp.]|nr:hypothetical protein [Janthinobacterium sp.]